MTPNPTSHVGSNLNVEEALTITKSLVINMLTGAKTTADISVKEVAEKAASKLKLPYDSSFNPYKFGCAYHKEWEQAYKGWFKKQKGV